MTTAIAMPSVRSRTTAAVPKTMSETAFEKWAMRNQVRAEWVDGEVRPMAPANRDHNRIQGVLSAALRAYVESKDLGEVFGPEYMVRLLPERPRRRIPDVLFVVKSRGHLLEMNYLDGPPDLAIEIVSPNDPSRDYREKFFEYEEAGVREYWIIDPSHEVMEVHARTRAGKFAAVALTDGRFKSKVIRGLSIDPRWVLTKRPTVLGLIKKLGVI